MKKLLSLFAIAALLMAQSVPSWAIGVQDQGTYEGELTTVNLSTGLSGSMGTDGIYTITGGAVGTDGNWTSSATDVTLDLAPTKFIATVATGDFFATGFTVGTGDITGANGAKIDLDTANEVRLIENSDTFKIGFSGDDITFDTTDGGFIFANTDATDGKVLFKLNNDTDDYMVFSTAANVPTIATLGTSNLAIAPDGGTVAFTADLTVSGTTPLVTIGDTDAEDAAILFDGNAQDFHVGLDDSADDFIIGLGSALGTTPIISLTDVGHTTVTGSTDGILTVWGAGTSASDAYLRLVGDAQTDASDSFQAFYDSSAGTLYLGIDDTTPGTYVTKASLDSTGAFTVQGSEATAGSIAIWADNGDDTADKWTLSVATTDVLSLINGSTTLFQFATTTGNITNVNSDVISFTTDDVISFESEDEVSTIRALGFEAKAANLRLYADQDDDATDGWQLQATTSGTLTIGNDSSVAGTDVVLTTVASAGDWTFAGTTPYLTIGDAGAEDAGLAFDGNAQDFNISLDDSTDDLVIGLGTAAGTTDAIRIDENQVVTFVQDVRGLGTDDLSGFLQTQVAATTTTLTAAQCGSTIVGDSADVLTLPEASTVLGCQYTIVSGTADDLDVNPNDATDHFTSCTASGGTIDGAAGDAYRLTDIGTSMTIEAIAADLWAVVAHNGPITDVN